MKKRTLKFITFFLILCFAPTTFAFAGDLNCIIYKNPENKKDALAVCKETREPTKSLVGMAVRYVVVPLGEELLKKIFDAYWEKYHEAPGKINVKK